MYKNENNELTKSVQDLITNPKLREKHMNRVEVLSKVGDLLLLPNTELATTKQVAEFYGVELNTLKQLIKRNSEELETNGVKMTSYLDIKESMDKGYNMYTLNELGEYGISRRGSYIFNKRAILLVGFMLRDSEIAQEVRNQALNIIESATDEHKTMEITKEKELLMAIMFASNEIERATAINEHIEYTNRHKKQLEETISKQSKVIDHKQDVIEGLTESISLAEKRQILNKVIRSGCYNSNTINNRWSFLYDQFEMKYHINVRVRKNNYNRNMGKKLTILDFIEKQMNMFDELYELAMKLFENDAKSILEQYEDVLNLKAK